MTYLRYSWVNCTPQPCWPDEASAARESRSARQTYR